MFDGALSPWHLAIVAVVVFFVFGPKKIANRVHGTREMIRRFVDEPGAADDPPTEHDSGAAPESHGLAYRLGRRLPGRRDARRARR